MFPEFKPIAFNPFEAMLPLLEGEEEEFVAFVKTLKRPEPKAKNVVAKKEITVHAPAAASSTPSPTTSESETKIPETFETWEEMAAFLES
jgi:hypothetical protein